MKKIILFKEKKIVVDVEHALVLVLKKQLKW